MSKDVHFIGGVQKCGTTSLHSSLIQHPEIRPAISTETGEEIKEVHFFSDGRYENGIQWYESHFADDCRCLDATPNYIAKTETLKRILDYRPDAKFIVSLRDPITRCISQHNHYMQSEVNTSGWDWRVYKGSLQENIEAELAEPFDEWQGLIARGYYATQLENLYKYVPKENTHIVIMEEWSLYSENTIQELLEFLEVSPIDIPMVEHHRRSYDGDPVPDSVIGKLKELYAEPNRQLFEMLGREIPEWIT